MKFDLTRIAAGIGMVIAAGSAQAVLTSSNTLSIQTDAVASFTASSSYYYVSSDGPLMDSFFTMGYPGSQTIQTAGTQYAYIYGASPITLSGTANPTVGTFTYYGAPGSNDTGGLPGLSILSASDDSASINMSNWKLHWNGVDNIPMGSGAWSAGYSNGMGNLTCTAGSGCAVGSAYTLKYTAMIPYGDPSGIGGAKYYLELHGTVGAVPEASTYGMMLAGLGLVGAAALRRRACPAD